MTDSQAESRVEDVSDSRDHDALKRTTTTAHFYYAVHGDFSFLQK